MSGSGSRAEHIAMAWSQGLDVDDDNKAALENVPAEGVVIDTTSNLHGQTWGGVVLVIKKLHIIHMKVLESTTIPRVILKSYQSLTNLLLLFLLLPICHWNHHNSYCASLLSYYSTVVNICSHTQEIKGKGKSKYFAQFLFSRNSLRCMNGCEDLGSKIEIRWEEDEGRDVQIQQVFLHASNRKVFKTLRPIPAT